MTNGTDTTNEPENNVDPPTDHGGFVFGTPSEGEATSEQARTNSERSVASPERRIIDRRTIAASLAVLFTLVVVVVVLGQIVGGIGTLLGGSPASVGDGTGDVLRGVTTTDATATTVESTEMAEQDERSTSEATIEEKTTGVGIEMGTTAGVNSAGDEESADGVEDGASEATVVESRNGLTRDQAPTGSVGTATRTQTDPPSPETTATDSEIPTGSSTDEATVPSTESPIATVPRERSPSIERFSITDRSTDGDDATVGFGIDWRVSDPDGDLDVVRVRLLDGADSARRVLDREVVTVGGSTASGDTRFTVDGSSGTPYEIVLVVEDRSGTRSLRVEREIADGEDD